MFCMPITFCRFSCVLLDENVYTYITPSCARWRRRVEILGDEERTSTSYKKLQVVVGQNNIYQLNSTSVNFCFLTLAPSSIPL